MDAAISPRELSQRLAAFPRPTLIDVRRQGAFEQDPVIIPGAVKRAPEDVDTWAGALEPWRDTVVYCVKGLEVGCDAAAALRRRGFDARYLEGGLAAWRAAGGATEPWAPPTRWVTRERPKIDRIACPWLIRRFIDPSAELFYVSAAEVRSFAAQNNATPYDVPDVAYSHAGPECSFDAFLRLHQLDDPALADLAAIVRAADTGTVEYVPQASGLLAASLGMSALFREDHAMLKWGMLVYDSLFAWCLERQAETERASRQRASA